MSTSTAQQSADLSASIGKVMGDVLQRAALTADEDFFDSGGDSLRAIEVLQQLPTAEGVSSAVGSTDMQAILLEEIFEKPTPSALATVISEHLR
ncbi:phosphopantetheine-binding protein [Plantactinospora sp. GCM10030261]|uniref:phosphopantetheine-binding protein n=1 Tax=Plantactinospora sp. GCM10030261 TaxID=3273420 RepID=UPI00360C9D59